MESQPIVIIISKICFLLKGYCIEKYTNIYDEVRYAISTPNHLIYHISIERTPMELNKPIVIKITEIFNMANGETLNDEKVLKLIEKLQKRSNNHFTLPYFKFI